MGKVAVRRARKERLGPSQTSFFFVITIMYHDPSGTGHIGDVF